MDTMNKSLITLVMVAIISCVVIAVSMSFLFLKNEERITTVVLDKAGHMLSDAMTVATQDKDFTKTTYHPYNECIKLFVEQAKEKGEVQKFDFDNVKSMCFELLHKAKDQEKETQIDKIK